MTPDERFKNAVIYGTSHPEVYMTKPDELWEKYSETIGFGLGTQVCVDKDQFLAALQEYGESVRQQAVRVCRKLASDADYIEENAEDAADQMAGNYMATAAYECAAAIEKMEIK